MAHRRYTVRPAEPHEVVGELAAAFLSATTVPRRRPVPMRQVLREIAFTVLAALAVIPVLIVVGALLAWLA